ncbi:MAG TPA: hypothetical protein VGS07_22165 [Thermoanaerobaculia bacterium]|jgi:hypothetical protein|nr:hypothetical protein [Thermoanaerobaculia bacterium]
MTRLATRLEWTIGLVVLSAAAVLLSAAAGDRAEPQHPNLQGTWKLNEDLTARMRQDDKPQGGPGGDHGGMGRHGDGSRRRGGGTVDGRPSSESGESGESRQGPPPSFASLDVLTITQQGDQLTVADKDGNTRVLKTDDHKIRDEKAPGGPVELRASWDKDGILNVEVKPDKGAKRTESYLVSNDGKHLYVTLVLDRNGHELKIRRAYDSAPEEKAPGGGADGEEDDDREVVA